MLVMIIAVIMILCIGAIIFELTDSAILTLFALIILFSILFKRDSISNMVYRMQNKNTNQNKNQTVIEVSDFEDVVDVLSQIQSVGIDNVESIIINYKKSRD